MKSNLPVIVLKNIVLLPNNDIRLEFDNDIDHNVIDVAELFHDNYILIVSQNDPLEEDTNINELPSIGTLGLINHKMELPNGKIRVIISGINRVNVHEYLNLNSHNEVLEAIVSNIKIEEMSEQEQLAYTSKLYRELENFVKTIPYIGNSILSQIINVNDIDKMTDMVAPHLTNSLIKLQEYLTVVKASERTEMILADIYQSTNLFDIEKDLDLKVRQELDNNQKEYLLREKIKLIKEELGDTTNKDDDIDIIREKIDNLKANDVIKNRLKVELKRFEMLNMMSPEINIVRNYIDWLLEIPWNIFTEDNQNLKDVRAKLDATHNGLEKIKDRIIEYLAVKQLNKDIKSPILCLVGPPGVGKTSLVLSIAESLNRKFVRMAVGGINDESEIIGHRRTYLGANPGRIIQGMKKAKSSNPIFLIDEIDKMTKDIKGDPASALLNILDPEQNKFFSDNYIEEEYDLSSVMFITTANYIDNIPEALRDRLEIIMLSGYTEYEKLNIAKTHLIPKICNNHGLKNNINFNDETILEIINSYTKEAGVRELERQLSTIVRKIVTSMVVNNIKINNLNIEISQLEIYLGKTKYSYHHKSRKSLVGVVNGLAYTYFGGDLLPIEVTFYKGKGDLVLTGSLGDVMKESAVIALSYIKSNYQYFKLDYNKITSNDIHIHVPEGAIPKDGPSAGVTLTTALISALSGKKVPSNIAMTGEITLRGDVLPIGGLKEKSMGAYRNGVNTILIPKDNMNDVSEFPKEIIDHMTYVPIGNYKDIYQYLMVDKVKKEYEDIRKVQYN